MPRTYRFVIERRGHASADKAFALIRDAELQRRVEIKGRWVLTLVVRRVDACGVEAIAATCARGDRTALKILRWVSPPARQ